MVDIASTSFDSNLLGKAVRKIARGSDETQKLARRRLAQAGTKTPGVSELGLQSKAAKTIVRWHALRSGVAGGGTGLIGAVPGVGTIVAISEGVTADVILQMKVNVDMCHALVYVFKPDMDPEEAFSLAVTLASYGTLERHGAKKFGRCSDSAGIPSGCESIAATAAGWCTYRNKAGVQTRRHRIHTQSCGESDPVRCGGGHRRRGERGADHLRGS